MIYWWKMYSFSHFYTPQSHLKPLLSVFLWNLEYVSWSKQVALLSQRGRAMLRICQ